MYGLIALTKRRVNLDETKQSSSWYDWYLITLIWTIFLTGIGAMVFRVLGADTGLPGLLRTPDHGLHAACVPPLVQARPPRVPYRGIVLRQEDWPHPHGR